MLKQNMLNPIVFTMGKVGSTSVSTAIRRGGLGCMDFHVLSKNFLLNRVKGDALEGNLPSRNIVDSLYFHKNNIIKLPNLYITLVRDPIARNLSAYFQNQVFGNIENPETIARHFCDHYNHTYPLSWFDREFNDNLKINVYDHYFDPSIRYLHVPEKSLLIFRSDCSDELKSSVLTEILETPVRIERVNVGTEKSYSKLYIATVAQVRRIIRHSLKEMLLSHKFTTHFFSSDEVNDFRDYWSGEAI